MDVKRPKDDVFLGRKIVLNILCSVCLLYQNGGKRQGMVLFAAPALHTEFEIPKR